MDDTWDESKRSIWWQIRRKEKTFSHLTVPSWSSESRTDLQNVILTQTWDADARSFVQPSLAPPGLEGKAAWSSRADACRVLLNYWTAHWQVFWGPAGGNVAPYWHLPSASDWGLEWELKWEFHGRESSVLRHSQSLTYIYIRSFSFKKNYWYEFGLPLPPKFWKGNFFRCTCEIILINLQNTLDCDHYNYSIAVQYFLIVISFNTLVIVLLFTVQWLLMILSIYLIWNLNNVHHRYFIFL